MHKILIVAAILSATVAPSFAGKNTATANAGSFQQDGSFTVRPNTPVSVPSRPSIPSRPPSLPSSPNADARR